MRKTLAIGIGLVLLATASPAYAADPTPSPDRTGRTPATAKAAVMGRIDLRLAALRRMDQRIDACKHLTDAHSSTLSGFVDNARDGLTNLRTKVASETTVEAVRADAKSMVNDYRVFLLRGPQVHLTCTADNEAAAIDRLKKAADTLAAGVAKAKQDGEDTADAEADLAAMNNEIGTAGTALAGRVDTLLALRPGPDGDAIRAQVRSVRQHLRTAWQALRRAVADAKQVRDFLKSA